MARVIPLTDAWFDIIAGSSRLRIATAEPGITEFWAQLDPGMPPIRFAHVADIKGRRVFEAMAAGPADGQGPTSPNPMLLISGPKAL